MTGSLFQDLVAVVERSHPRFGSLVPFAFGGGAGGGNQVRNVVGIAGQPGTCEGSGLTCSRVQSGASVQDVLGGQSVWTAVPGICKRYQNGTLTQDGLWPWPMEARMEAALAQAGKRRCGSPPRWSGCWGRSRRRVGGQAAARRLRRQHSPRRGICAS